MESVVVVALLAALLAFALPSFALLGSESRLGALTNEFVAALRLARDEAILRNAKVLVCKSATGQSCDREAEWEQGWLVFVDADDDRRVDADETRLRVHAPLPAGYTLRGNRNFTNRVSYTPLGDATSIGRFMLCRDNRLSGATALFISASGRIRLGADDNGDRIPEDYAGKNVTGCMP